MSPEISKSLTFISYSRRPSKLPIIPDHILTSNEIKGDSKEPIRTISNNV